MSQNTPLITIITVAYNAEDFLEQTIKSIIGQNYPNIEYIVIDGKSTDGTINIIKKYEQYIDHWISEPDDGIYDAMNKGVALATGDWINFLNAGDSFCGKTTISEVSKHLDKHSDLISGDIYYIQNNQKKYIKSRGFKFAFSGMFCFHQTLFTRTSLIKKYMFNAEYKIAGDYDFVLKCYINNYAFKFLDLPIANFLSGGMNEQHRALSKIENLFIQTRYLTIPNEIDKAITIFKHSDTTQDNNYSFALYINKFYEALDEQVKKNKQFILYGFGHIGQLIYQKYKTNIISIVDQNFKALNQQYPNKIEKIESIRAHKDEYIIISALGRELEIESLLVDKFNIPTSKILKLIV